MPLFSYHSWEQNGGIARKRFEFVATIGELDLYAFRGDGSEDHAPLWVKISDSMVLNARMKVRDIERHRDKIPTTIKDWKSAVCEILKYDKYLPIDAAHFGFTEEEIKADRDRQKFAREARQAERERKAKEREEIEADWG